MQLSDLGPDAIELSRSLAPIEPEALNSWREGTVVVARRGRRGPGHQEPFVRIDYLATSSDSPPTVELSAARLDPLTREPTSTLGQERFELGRTPDGVWSVELRTPLSSGGAMASEIPVRTVEWLAAAFPDPTAGEVSPLRLEIRLESNGISDPQSDQ